MKTIISMEWNKLTKDQYDRCEFYEPKYNTALQ